MNLNINQNHRISSYLKGLETITVNMMSAVA